MNMVFYHGFSLSESLEEEDDSFFDLFAACCSCSSCFSLSASSEAEFVLEALELVDEDWSTRVRDESMERLVVVIFGLLSLSFFILRAGRGSLYLVKL